MHSAKHEKSERTMNMLLIGIVLTLFLSIHGAALYFYQTIEAKQEKKMMTREGYEPKARAG